MATSGSTDFSVTRDNIIADALSKIGVLAAGETVTSTDTAFCARALNMMIKAWSTRGLQLWAQKQATLFLAKNTHSYSLGPTGTNATHSYTRTTISADEAAGQTIISVTSETGMIVADKIGIVLDDGSLHWSTISSLATLTIANALPSAAASGNSVYFYTTKMHRPLRIVYAYLHDVLTNADWPLTILKERGDYFGIYDKTLDSQPSRIYYDPQLTNGVLYTDYEQTDVNEVLNFIYQRPYEDFDAAADNPDFPQEWFESLVYGLAIRVAPDYGIPSAIRNQIIAEVSALNINLGGFYGDGPTRVTATAF